MSGSGNVAQYTCEKLLDLGAKPISLSDSSGYIIDKDGIDREKLEYILWLKNIKRGRIKEYAEKFGCDYAEGAGMWNAVKCDVAFPSATQNEVDGEAADALLGKGCMLVSEGANMPSTPAAIDKYMTAKIMYGPGKAANAGGVATSGLEMSQNSLRLSWTREEVDTRLRQYPLISSRHSCARPPHSGHSGPMASKIPSPPPMISATPSQMSSLLVT